MDMPERTLKMKGHPMKRTKVIDGIAYIEKLDVSAIWSKKWKGLLQNWIKLMDEYRVTADDLPYWHGENANTGFLAAAAWKSGGVAIEQFYTERNNGKSRGHSDLRICFNKQKDFLIEAKRDETSKIEIIERNIRKQLDEAKKNLKALDNKRKVQHLVSVCFSFPRMQKNAKFSRDEYIKTVTEAFKKEKNIVIASYFPGNDKKKVSKEYGDSFIYWGVLLVARKEIE